MSIDPDRTDSPTKLADWVKGTPPVVYLLLFALILSAIFTISDGLNRVADYYQEHYQWRQTEYSRLRKLHAGISMSRAEELLGSPLFVRANEDNTLGEGMFEGRDYWVHTVYDRTGTIVLLAVTSCSPSFTPTFENPIGDVTLNKTRFGFPATAPPEDHRYFISGATANSFLFDQYNAGNPGFYKTYFMGANDACPAFLNFGGATMEEVSQAFRGTRDAQGNWQFQTVPASLLHEFRANSAINTYAEMNVDADVGAILRQFQIGVDRQLTRTVHPEQERFTYD